ncbi:hypothetical protein BH11ACT1_BH11ACT1_08690 [soil metagenome]
MKGRGSQHAVGDVLQVAIDAPTYETAKFGAVPVVDAVATWDAETGAVALFAVNRSLTETVELSVDVRSLPGLARVVAATSLANPDHTWAATVDDATSVLPRPNTSAALVDGRLTVQVPPVSWNVVRLGS